MVNCVNPELYIYLQQLTINKIVFKDTGQYKIIHLENNTIVRAARLQI